MAETLVPLSEPAVLPSAQQGCCVCKVARRTAEFCDLSDDIRAFGGPRLSTVSAIAQAPFSRTIPFSQPNLSRERERFIPYLL